MSDDDENTTLQLIKDQQREITTLQNKLKLYEAFDILRLKLAYDKIVSTGVTTFKASGVIVDIRKLDGMSITGAFGISDGLSEETIRNLSADIERTLKGRIEMHTPVGLRQNTHLLFRSLDGGNKS